MTTGYTRTDIANNISDGNIINASDFDAEFDALQTTFNATLGHSHNGTLGEGAPILNLGPVQDVTITASTLQPKTDNTVDLGTTTLEFKDLWIDGVANIDSLVADTVDINAGTIDATVIGGATPAAGTFTSLAATSATVGGVTVATISTVQTLTNKTVSVDDNTVSGIAASSFVLSNASGNIDGAAAQKVIPSGAVVGTTDTQTLTNKTLTAPTMTGAILNDGYTEEVFAVTGTTPALSPTDGSIQTWTLSGNSTPTAGTWASGQSITLLVDDGTAYAITWATIGVVFKTDAGVAPTLNTTGETVIELWKVGSTIYGARVGNA